MPKANDNCSWLTPNGLCGKSCVKELCRKHRYLVNNGVNPMTPCEKCGKGTRLDCNICSKCGGEKIMRSIRHKAKVRLKQQDKLRHKELLQKEHEELLS